MLESIIVAALKPCTYIIVSVPDFLSQLELECEKERYRAEIGSLVTFVKAGVGNWSHDLDACS